MKPTKFFALLTALIAGVFILSLSSCSKDTIPSLTTKDVSIVTDTSAKVGGEVTDDGGASVTERGVCYNTSSNPSISDNPVQSGSGTGIFECTITGLDPLETYFYKAFAINSAGVGYGEQKSFTTQGGGGSGCEGITSVNYKGQIYNTVEIGDQCWFKENLNYQTGNSWCYNDNSANCTTYGRLYDWGTAVSVCPLGWHLPTDEAWIELRNFLGGYYVAGGHMKETGIAHWKYPNKGATNSSGFTALPGGVRHIDGDFDYIGMDTHYWSSTEYRYITAGFIYLYYSDAWFEKSNTLKGYGFSVRCLKD